MDVTIRLTDEESAKLKEMAKRDRRTPAAQAAYLVAEHVGMWARGAGVTIDTSEDAEKATRDPFADVPEFAAPQGRPYNLRES